MFSGIQTIHIFIVALAAGDGWKEGKCEGLVSCLILSTLLMDPKLDCQKLRSSLGNALNNPKVRYEWGDGGAPEEAGKRLALLEETYREVAMELQAMGYNGIDTFDLELPVAKPKFDRSVEEKIQEYMKQGHMKAGNMM